MFAGATVIVALLALNVTGVAVPRPDGHRRCRLPSSSPSSSPITLTPAILSPSARASFADAAGAAGCRPADARRADHRPRPADEHLPRVLALGAGVAALLVVAVPATQCGSASHGASRNRTPRVPRPRGARGQVRRGRQRPAPGRGRPARGRRRGRCRRRAGGRGHRARPASRTSRRSCRSARRRTVRRWPSRSSPMAHRRATTASSCRTPPGSVGASPSATSTASPCIGNSTIGDDCMIRQGVTLGQDRATPGVLVRNVPAPRLGNRVEIGAGAMLVGGITDRRRGADRAERGGDDQRAGRGDRHRAPVAHHGPAEAPAEAGSGGGDRGPAETAPERPRRPPESMPRRGDRRPEDGMNLSVPGGSPAPARRRSRRSARSIFAGRRYEAAAAAFAEAADLVERPAPRAGAEARPRRARGRPAGRGRGAADGPRRRRRRASRSGRRRRAFSRAARSRPGRGCATACASGWSAPGPPTPSRRCSGSPRPGTASRSTSTSRRSASISTPPSTRAPSSSPRRRKCWCWRPTTGRSASAPSATRPPRTWRPSSTAGAGSGRRCAGSRRRSWCSSVSPPPAATRWATMAPGCRAPGAA